MTQAQAIVAFSPAELHEATKVATDLILQGATLIQQGQAAIAEGQLLLEMTGLAPGPVEHAPAPVISLADYAARQAVQR